MTRDHANNPDPNVNAACAITFAIVGILLGWILPIVRPGPSRLVRVFDFALVGGTFGLVIDVLKAHVVSYLTRDHQHNPDPNVTAARIVAESIHDDRHH